jgi:ABC-type antimicrobial peptide transport system permease subunit
MKNLEKEDLLIIVAFALLFTAVLGIVASLHIERMKMIEAGYVKQPEMWVKP